MTESILNSSQAVTILHLISEKEEGMYSKEIAENIDKSVNTVNNMVRNLYRLGLIKKGKRNKAQYYRINAEGIGEFWIKEIEQFFEEVENKEKIPGLVSHYNIFKENKEEIQEFVEIFLPLTFQRYEPRRELTLKQVMFEKVANTITEMETLGVNPELLEENEYITKVPLLVKYYLGTKGEPVDGSYALGADINLGGVVIHREPEE